MLSSNIFFFLLIATFCSVTRSNRCGFRTTLLQGVIGTPEDRRLSAFCVWTISVPDEHRIKIRSSRFSIAGEKGTGGICYYAWLTISGTIENNVTIHRTFCATKSFPAVLFFGNYVNINYYFNGAGESFFTLVYHAVRLSIREKTAEWISNNAKSLVTHKESLPRALTALRLFDETYFDKKKEDGYRFKSEYLQKLSADLLRNSSQPLSATDLSHHVFALLAVCTNPHSFHGFDLVQDLRNIVDMYPNLHKPFDSLALCNAGSKSTPRDITKLISVLRTKTSHLYMLDFQAIAIMALICAKRHSKELDIDASLRNATEALISYQRTDGSFGSLRSTVFIVQALSAAEANESSWNRTAALQFVESSNHSDGSFGNIDDMYAVLPLLGGKTFLDVNAEKCHFSLYGTTSLQEIKDKMTELISLTYQIWIGDGAELRNTVALKFPNGTKFLDVMRLAAEKHKHFQLKWTFLKHDLYVYEIDGHINDPTSGKYWNLYTFNENNQLVLFEERLENYVPVDGGTAVMWYRTVDLH